MRQTPSKSSDFTTDPIVSNAASTRARDGKDYPDRATSFVVIALACAIANLRPTAIGGTYSFQVCCVILLLLVALVFQAERGKFKVDLEPQMAAQLGIFVLIVCYLFARSAFSLNFHGEESPKAFLISVVFLIALFIVTSIRRFTTLFFDTFASVVIASSASLIITFGLIAAGSRVSSLIIFKIDLAGYGGNFGSFAFPLTAVANEVSGWFGSTPRLSGIFREPGVFPPFACWAATYAFLRGWRTIFVAMPLVASMLSLSTIGPLSLFTGAILVLYRLRFQPITALIIIIAVGSLIWPALYTMEYIGLAAKINSKSGSFEERSILFTEALNVENLWFGDGFGWGSVSSTEGISLVSQLRVYGLFYFVLVIALYFLTSRNMRLWIPGCLPALLAVIFSQPISVEPAFLMIFFSWSAFQASNPGSPAERTHSNLIHRHSTSDASPSFNAGPNASFLRRYRDRINRSPLSASSSFNVVSSNGNGSV